MIVGNLALAAVQAIKVVQQPISMFFVLLSITTACMNLHCLVNE